MSNPRIALYEFMPYGAPELLENSDRHLARAMTAAMALPIAIFLALLFALPLLPRAPIAIAPLMPPVILEPPPTLLQHEIAPIVLPGPRPTVTHTAVPLPVPDAAAPVVNTPAPQGDITRATGSTGEATSQTPVSDVTGIPATPDPNAFEYHEEYPSLVTMVKPEYPDLARQAGVEGQVVVLALVGVDGHVKEVRLAKSVPLLDAAAIDAVRKWVFTPALDNHHPVPAWVRVPVIFRLH